MAARTGFRGGGRVGFEGENDGIDVAGFAEVFGPAVGPPSVSRYALVGPQGFVMTLRP